MKATERRINGHNLKKLLHALAATLLLAGAKLEAMAESSTTQEQSAFDGQLQGEYQSHHRDLPGELELRLALRAISRRERVKPHRFSS